MKVEGTNVEELCKDLDVCIAAHLRAQLTSLRALNAELVGDIQTLIKCVPDQNWNQMEDKEAFYEVVEKYNPTLAQPENSFRSRAKGEKADD